MMQRVLIVVAVLLAVAIAATGDETAKDTKALLFGPMNEKHARLVHGLDAPIVMLFCKRDDTAVQNALETAIHALDEQRVADGEEKPRAVGVWLDHEEYPTMARDVADKFPALLFDRRDKKMFSFTGTEEAMGNAEMVGVWIQKALLGSATPYEFKPPQRPAPNQDL